MEDIGIWPHEAGYASALHALGDGRFVILGGGYRSADPYRSGSTVIIPGSEASDGHGGMQVYILDPSTTPSNWTLKETVADNSFGKPWERLWPQTWLYEGATSTYIYVWGGFCPKQSTGFRYTDCDGSNDLTNPLTNTQVESTCRDLLSSCDTNYVWKLDISTGIHIPTWTGYAPAAGETVPTNRAGAFTVSG